jgi:hypothetical protein
MLWPALLALVQITDTAAQTLPIMGYVAPKNANPKRLEIFKQARRSFARLKKRTSASNTARQFGRGISGRDDRLG